MGSFVSTIRTAFKRSAGAHLASIVLAVSVLAPNIAAADALQKAKSAGKLVVVTEMQFAPFDMKVDGKYVGVNRDLFDEIGKELGLAMDYVDLPWTSVLPGLESGKFDFVGAPINATKERVTRYAFTNPFAFSGSAFMKRKGDAAVTKPEDLKGQTVGVVKSSAILRQVQRFNETTPVTIREYSDNNQLYADLAIGRVTAAASSLANVSYAAQQRPDTFEVVKPTFGIPTYYGWIARNDEDSKSLIAAINVALAKVIADGRMAAIQKKWFGEAYDLPAVMPEPQI
ncbi:transporter substrate-binding domain-containing protein [Agrobacterium vitis]|uniref:Amino acid ABC transporter n=1 Tax=Agrobacterium vitis TaxID=373 RepID=A0A368NN04_AGRVI|nr:transporter substrate-binding domain-containing protein [Agrobacterium vitis]KAA3506247.1 amino acid ABC transporter [Agrobacterium vitis]KAA3520676.1 amino acid ABC transporter [Agrobacterium vitis]MBF2714275.1 transporter substrate-binding domain-containing protein [Agrobacterium vitis]MBF2718211.1 transporter substrate-binding domain-containing protein [Agrobacterium vitis]MCF1480135.1 transporter substrate-binding domain-containing protein [Agrobacterium vitis]